jgi:chromosome partitioning protein
MASTNVSARLAVGLVACAALMAAVPATRAQRDGERSGDRVQPPTELLKEYPFRQGRLRSRERSDSRQADPGSSELPLSEPAVEDKDRGWMVIWLVFGVAAALLALGLVGRRVVRTAASGQSQVPEPESRLASPPAALRPAPGSRTASFPRRRAGRRPTNAWERQRTERSPEASLAPPAKGGPSNRPAVHDPPALKQHIVDMRASGMTLQAIADRLNAEGVPTLRRGQKWRPSSVQAAVGGPSNRPAVHDPPALKQHIVDMRASGMTLRAIADRLNAEGVPTLRRGQKWRPSGVQAAAGYHRPPQPRAARYGGLPHGGARGGRSCFAVVNQKGGVGKTTVSLALGAAAVRRARHVLLLDLDPQASATSVLGAEFDDRPTMTDVMLNHDRTLAEAVRATGWGMDLAPADRALRSADSGIAADADPVLPRQLETVGDYDLMLIDCPPNLGALTINALAAASHALVVTEPTFLALHAMEELLDTLHDVAAEQNPSLELAGVVLNRVETTAEHKHSVAELEDTFGSQVWEPHVPKRAILQDAMRLGVPPQDLQSHSHYAIEIAEIFDALAVRVEAIRVKS